METRVVTPTFAILTLATLAYFLSFSVLIPVLPLYIGGPLGGGSLAVGVGVGSFSIAAVLLRPLVGRMGDRRGRHILMVVGGVLALVSVTGYQVATHLFILIAFRIVQGAGEACFFVGAATAINDIAPVHRRAEAVSYFSVSVHLSLALGPALGETTMGGDRFRAVFLVASILALVAVVLALRVPDTRTAAVTAASDENRSLVQASAVIPGSALGLGILAFSGFFAFAPLYAPLVGLSGSKFVYLTFSGTVLLMRLVGARVPDRFGTVRVGTLALTVTAGGMGVIGLWQSPAGLFVGTVLMACGVGFSFPALMSLTVSRAPEEERSAAIGTFTAFFDLASGVGSVITGSIIGIAGYRPAFLTVAGLALTGPALLVAAFWKARQPPRGRLPAGPTDRRVLGETLAAESRVPFAPETDKPARR